MRYCVNKRDNGSPQSFIPITCLTHSPMMKATLVMAILASSVVFAKNSGHLDPEEDALDCPMLDVRIQGGLTEMQPGINTWEECGA